jgi:caffeoyl-CoA O-methyltransferase
MIRGYDLRPDRRADRRVPPALRAMTPRSFLLTPELHDYVRASSEPPDGVAADLLAETAAMAERGEAPATFQIAPEQGAFMQLLTRALGVRQAIEIGTFTGFSALCIARGLPEDGNLVCLDRSEEWTAVARRYWARAGVDDRIDLRLGDALTTLRSLPSVETFGLAFVDADKTGYPAYVEELYGRMTPNGIVLLDNTLRSGKVLDPQSEDDRALVGLNAALAVDPRWETVLLPMADGLTMLRKR